MRFSIAGFMCVVSLPFVCLCVAQIPTFQDIAPTAGVNNDGLGVGVAFPDVNNDGLDDIHLINDSQTNEYDHLYLNQGDLTFQDITLSAGVYDPPFSNSVRVADIDNDGWQDMIITTSNLVEGSRLYRNNHDNTFSDWFPWCGIPNRYYSTCDWGDINSDGWVDLYMLELFFAGFNAFYLAAGGGTYNLFYLTGGNSCFGCDAQFCDFDGDGDLDLFQGICGCNQLFENDYPEFHEIGAIAGVAGHMYDFTYVTIGDYDNDGLFDVFAFNNEEYVNTANFLYHQDDWMQFTNVTGTSGIRPMDSASCGVWGDLDNDGWLDLLTFDWGNTTRLWHNNGDGTFTDVAREAELLLVNSSVSSLALGDINNDGFLDIYVVRYDPENRLFLNRGNGNHWLQISLQGTDSNRLGIGTRVKAVAGDLVQWRDIGGGRWGSSSNAPYVHLGLGSHSIVDSIYVMWSSGRVDILTDVLVDQRITVVEGTTHVGDLDPSNVPVSFELFKAYPNPFNPLTTLGFSLPVTSRVSLVVYDVTGRRVASLVDGAKPAGTYQITFDGSGLASGVYFCRLQAGEFTAVQKMVLVK